MRCERLWCTMLTAALALAAPAAARSADPAAAPPADTTAASSADPAATSPAARAAPPPSAEAAPAAPLRLADLAWLAGSWRGTLGGAAIEEHWSAPDGGEMIGMFRWARESPIYELLLIADTPEGVVMRLRHFGPGLTAWEEKEGALPFRPVEHGPCWALFAEEGDDEERTRLRYARQEDGGLLIQVIERRDGADGSLDFRYRPADPAAAAPCG